MLLYEELFTFVFRVFGPWLFLWPWLLLAVLRHSLLQSPVLSGSVLPWTLIPWLFLTSRRLFRMLRGMLALLRGSGLQLFAAFRKFLFLLLLLFGLVEPGEAVLSDYVAIFSCLNLFRIEFEGIDLHALLIERDNFKSSPCIDGDKIGRNVAVG